MQNLTKNLKNLEPVSFACGGFAVVHKALLYPEDPFKSQVVAVKFPNVRNIAGGEDAECAMVRTKVLQRWQREIAAGQSVVHPNVLPFLGFCDNPDNRFKEFDGIVLPFCKNRDASSYLHQHPKVDRLHILVSIAAALFALHKRSSPVVHGDIKASNILIDEHGNPLLADFGLSRVCDTKGFTTNNIMGSTRWMPVELLRALIAIPDDGASANDQIVRTTRASDIWAFGMTILEMLTGDVPFYGYFDAAVIVGVALRNARPQRPRTSHISEAIWNLLEHCWTEAPSERPNARHVGLALDIIYGHAQGTIDVHTMSAILVGALDNVVPQAWQTQSGSASRPYACKWLHCSRAFDCIDDCVTHECAEFESRRSAVCL